MAEPLKNLLSPDVVRGIADVLGRHRDFDKAGFLRHALNGLEALELMQRSDHIAACLADSLPSDFHAALKILHAALHPETDAPLSDLKLDGDGLRGWALVPVGAYVANAGLPHPEDALTFLREMTKRFSAEFAVRPFLRDRTDLALRHATAWAQDDNYHVRRLASEGTRPRLPWGLRLQSFVQNPAPLLPILTRLRDDPSEYVRRSVANSLNDIAKDHPDLIVTLARDWLQDAPPERRKLVKHACRSLIKSGDPAALAVFGYGPPKDVSAVLSVTPRELTLGDTLTVDLTLTSLTALPVLVDLVVGFRKADERLSPKVFKWTETDLKPCEPRQLTKRLPLRPVTTRAHYPGRHSLGVQVNGQTLAETEFTLIVPD